MYQTFEANAKEMSKNNTEYNHINSRIVVFSK